MRFKRLTCFVLALLIVLPLSLSSSAFAAATNDSSSHWAMSTLQKWKDQGLLQGYGNGQVRPDAPVTRAEFAAFLNRAFGLKEQAASLSFVDLASNHWGYRDISIAYQAGYIKGDSRQKVNPNGMTARQEAAVMLAGALQLNGPAKADLSMFKDANLIAGWASKQVAALVEQSVMQGDRAGNFRPLSPITRAEAIVAIDNALTRVKGETTVISKPGVYGSAAKKTIVNGDVTIAAAGVTLINYEIKGNLLLGKEIGEGDVYLKQVKVDGKTTVAGGGQNSIHLEDSVLVQIVVNKATGTVRIVVSGSTTVQKVTVQSPVKLEESTVTDSGVKDVELSPALPEGSKVELAGQFESVSVLASRIVVSISSGSVQNMEVASGATGAEINLSKEAQIIQLVLEAVTKMIGEGKVVNATVQEGAKGSSFETKPEKVDGAGNSGASGGSTAGGGGGGGGGDGGTGGGNGGGTPPAVCTALCSSAFLSKLTFGDYTLTQRDETNSIVGEGFSKSVFSYTLDVPRDITEQTVGLSIATESEWAGVFATVNYQDGTQDTFDFKGKKEIDIKLKPLEDVHINIFVHSSDAIYNKAYSFSIRYVRTIQEGFKVQSSGYVDPAGIYRPVYTLLTEAFEKTDKVEVYLFDQPIPNLDCNESPFSNQKSCYLGIWSIVPDFPTSLYIKVLRDNSVLAEGDYIPNMAPVPVIENITGVDVRLYTTAELDEWNRLSLDDFSTGGSITISVEQLPESLKTARYIGVADTYSIFGYEPQPRPWHMDHFKASANLWNFSGWSGLNDTSSFYSGSAETIYDQYLYIVFLDQQRNPIGVYNKLLQFDEAHAATGAKLAKNTTVDPNDTTKPELTVSIRDFFNNYQVSSTETGTVYVLPSSYDLSQSSRKAIHQFVQQGIGMAVPITANTPVHLETVLIPQGEFQVVAADAAGNLSDPATLAINRNLTIVRGIRYNSGVSLHLSQGIDLNMDPSALKTAISTSTDGGATYQPLDQNDTVTVQPDDGSGFWRIFVDFATPFTGDNNYWKIASGTFKINNSPIEAEVISSYKAGALLNVVEYAPVLLAGDKIIFSADKPTTVYFVPEGTLGSQTQFEAAAQGRVYRINADNVPQTFEIDTSGLQAGNYLIWAWEGQIILVTIQ
ncbi:S-layer homology domain-containing protein [Cohnella sp.]|uniref:S-layer homology domain-containing protein n=1 Tax=Cohnella sp. TaxID=1883426 RepID=UPI00356247CC